MNEYSEFPPIRCFMRVLKTCPKSALLYTQLWLRRGRYMNIEIGKKDVRKEYLISPTVFRNLLTPLMLLNLIHFVESVDKFQIDVAGPHLNE